jgi:hypothetical protein
MNRAIPMSAENVVTRTDQNHGISSNGPPPRRLPLPGSEGPPDPPPRSSGPMTMAIGGCEAVGSASSVPVAVGSGVDPGVAVDAFGFLVGLGLVELRGLAVAFGFGFAVGFAVGLGVGFAVGLGVGFGVAAGLTTIVPGETLERVTVLAPPPEPLVAVKVYVWVPAASFLLTRKVAPDCQFEPDAVIGIGPTPEIVTTTDDGAQPPVSA